MWTCPCCNRQFDAFALDEIYVYPAHTSPDGREFCEGCLRAAGEVYLNHGTDYRAVDEHRLRKIKDRETTRRNERIAELQKQIDRIKGEQE